MPTFWDTLQAKTGAWLAGTTVEEEQMRSDALDRAKDKQDIAAIQKYGPAWYKEVQSNETRADKDNLSAYGQNVAGQIEQGFEEGWADGEKNVADTFKGLGTVAGDVVGSASKGIGQGIWEVVKKIPLWVWIAGGLILFFSLGGATLIRGAVARRAAK